MIYDSRLRSRILSLARNILVILITTSLITMAWNATAIQTAFAEPVDVTSSQDNGEGLYESSIDAEGEQAPPAPQASEEQSLDSPSSISADPETPPTEDKNTPKTTEQEDDLIVEDALIIPGESASSTETPEMDQGISPDKNLEPNESAGVTQENSPETIVDEFATQETAYDNNPASILDGKDNAGAYAILYDDGDLIIQRGNTYDAGKQSSGIGVIAVYTGFEGDENNPHAFTKNGEEYGLWNRYSNNDENELPLIKTIKATSAIQAPASLGGFFYGAENATSADLANLDVSNTTEMFNVFYNCANLVDLNISGWDTSEVTNMSAMFYGCSFLETVDLSGFNTTNVSDMSFMFFGCVSIEELDLSNFKTENLTYTNSMFANMPMLRHIDISGFAISEAAFTDAFWECSLIETISAS